MGLGDHDRRIVRIEVVEHELVGLHFLSPGNRGDEVKPRAELSGEEGSNCSSSDQLPLFRTRYVVRFALFAVVLRRPTSKNRLYVNRQQFIRVRSIFLIWMLF